MKPVNFHYFGKESEKVTSITESAVEFVVVVFFFMQFCLLLFCNIAKLHNHLYESTVP